MTGECGVADKLKGQLAHKTGPVYARVSELGRSFVP